MSNKDKKDQKMETKDKKDDKKTDLGSLEEDDDFEEFPVEGMEIIFCQSHVKVIFVKNICKLILRRQ